LEREALVAQSQASLRSRPSTTPANRITGAGDASSTKTTEDSKERTAEQIRLQRINLNRKSMETSNVTTPSKAATEPSDGSTVVRRLISSNTPLTFINSGSTSMSASIDENGRIRYVRKVLPSSKSDMAVGASKNSPVVATTPAAAKVESTAQKVYRTTGTFAL